MDFRHVRIARAIAAAGIAAVSLAGCDVMSFVVNDGVGDPMTPDQARAQVVDAARDIVRGLDLTVVAVNFSRASCNDQGEAPFRGEVNIFYPRPQSFDEADRRLSDMTQRLRNAGWSGDSDFQSHGTVLKKNGVDAVFYPANVSVPEGNIVLHGECRDVTTSKSQAGNTEYITFN